MERAGIISGLERQVKYELQPKYRNGNDQLIRAINYVADFEYIDNASGRLVIEDVKGQRTAVYKLKKKLFEHRYSPMIITEVNSGR